jgi:serine/threonine protein kinase
VLLDRNLAELSLVDASLDKLDAGLGQGSTISRTSSVEAAKTNGKSQYVLAMYDAFANPKSGLINLVVEYMDGGSLADLVANGGCQDEAVLADVATQVLKGLHFLHSKMQMHVRVVAYVG